MKFSLKIHQIVYFFSINKNLTQGHYKGVVKIKGEIHMPQIDVNQLNQAKANVTLTQSLLTQAIEKASADPTLAQEAIKQAASEISSALTAVTQVQNSAQAQSSE